MSFDYIAQQFANGLILGSMYALVAVGFSMIYGIMRLINFAHGDIVMIGAFTTLFFLQAFGLPLPIIAILVLMVGFIIGVLIEKSIFYPMRGSPQVTGFIASLALSVMLQNAGILFLTAQPRNFNFPEYMVENISIGNISFKVMDCVIIITTIILMVALLLLINKTRLGIAIRATAQNLDVAKMMGININRTIMITFGIGSSIAAIAGLMWGGKFGQVDPLMGYVPGLKAFVAAVIGGVGSIPGAILGGIILGISEVLFVGLLPPEYSIFRDAFVFTILIVILIIMPNGLLGKSIEERA